MKIALLGLVCVLVPTLGFADPFAIQVLSTQYTTTVKTGATFLCCAADGTGHSGPLPDPVTRTTTSNAPVSDSLDFMSDEWAVAHADLFAVSTQTDTHTEVGPYSIGIAEAAATSVLTFQPTADGNVTLALAFIGIGEAFYSFGQVDLRDLTTQQALWAYGWDCCSLLNDTVPWVRPTNGGATWTAQLAPVAWLTADHQYALTLYVTSDANEDQQDMTITATGLEPTPEPASLMVIAAGLVAAGVRRWRR